MHLKSDAEHWGDLAKLFHWTIVLLLIVQGTLGLYMVDMPKKPAIIPYYNFHKSLGITILILAVLRLAWRAFDRHPQYPTTMPRWQVIAARAGHVLLYALLFLVPLSGWWFDSVSALRPTYFWGLFELPKLGGPDPAIPDLKDVAAARHAFLFWTLVLIACGHAATALAHHFVSHDGLLARMLPGRRALANSVASAISQSPPPPPATQENADA